MTPGEITIGALLKPMQDIKRAYRKLAPNRIKETIQKVEAYVRLGSASRYWTEVEGLGLVFSMEDSYSRGWFLRYGRGGVHEKAVTLRLLSALEGIECFVDVGTNLGWYTCLAGKKLPGGTVYGFEMDEYNYALLRKNLELNRCENVKIWHAAVTDAPGSVTYTRSHRIPSPVYSLSYGPQDGKRTREPEEEVHVESVTLDEFFERAGVTPDVIKIDVEGAEMKVLEGMRELLEKETLTLFVEVPPLKLQQLGSSVPEVLSFLVDRGYKLSKIERAREATDEGRLRSLTRTSLINRNSMIIALNRQ